MCALSSLPLLLSLAPFLSLFFHLPPHSSSLRNLVNILLPYTSCMSSALGATYPIAVSVTFMTWTKIVLFVWMSRKSPLGPKHQATVGSCKCWIASLRLNSTLKLLNLSLASASSHKEKPHTDSLNQSALCLQQTIWWSLTASHTAPFTTVVLIFILPCSPVAPVSLQDLTAHTHTHGFDNK